MKHKDGIYDVIPENLKLISSKIPTVKIGLTANGKMWTVEMPELNIDGVVYSLSEIEDLFKEEINYLWNEIVKEKNDKLSSGAIELKNTMLSYFQEI